MRLLLVLATTVACLLAPLNVLAADGPVDVVQRVYGRVLKVIRADSHGKKLCTLRGKPEYQKEDFTEELYQLMREAQQSFRDFQDGKRTNYWDQEILTACEANNLNDYPTYKLQSQSADRAIVRVVADGRGFTRQNAHDDNNPKLRVPYSWDVEVVKSDGRWRIANLVFPHQKDLVTQVREFLSKK